MNEHIKSLVEKLDWRADPKPSPYQRAAWQELLAMETSEVLPALEAHWKKLLDTSPWFPHNYPRQYKKEKKIS
jgi:hypothetical protein